MPIIFQCSCGRTLKVDDQYRGKKAKCPGCANLLTVEAAPVPEVSKVPEVPKVETAVEPEKPAKRLTPAVADDEAGMPEIRKPIKRPMTAAKRNMFPWLAVGGCVTAIISCLACGGIGAWYYRSRTGDADQARQRELESERVIEKRQGEQKKSQKKLATLVKAMHKFHDACNSLPNHAILDPQTGQPLLSWRVAILPYLDEKDLYARIHLNEPWDSPHNRQFWNRMPKTYEHPRSPHNDKTYYQVFHGKESVFPKIIHPPYTDRSYVTLAGITDGTSHTLFIVEAAEPVNWMNPEDISFKASPDGFPLDLIGNHWGDDTFLAAFGDAEVRRLRRTLPPLILQALITRAGGEPVDISEWLANP